MASKAIITIEVGVMLRTIHYNVPWIAACTVLAAPQSAVACAACMGRADDLTVQGLNAAVLTMLGALAMVLAAIAGSMIYFVRRAVKHPLALPGAPGGEVR